MKKKIFDGLEGRAREVANMLNQVRCEKHELVMVTQTTTTTGIGEPKIESISWMQCKNCSYTIPIPQQQPLNPKQ